MPIYDKLQLSQKAKELKVVRDTLEKVCRLQEILRFFDSSELLRTHLALKGGTAINLLFFNLPRLSVDIDLDFCQNISREEMLERREKINSLISKYMAAEGYSLSPNTKTPHSLDSFVYNYINSAGMKDNIKIEINYSLRAHILPTQHITVKSPVFNDEITVNTVSVMEIYASKTVALLSRSAARDLYDMNYMIKYDLFDESEIEVYRKCVIFYLAVGTISPMLKFDFSSIERITLHKITTDLKPVVRDRDSFDLKSAQKTVIDFLKETIILTEKEEQFLKDFQKGYYHPDLLFDNTEILERIADHPMAIWKTNKNRNLQSN